jgi:hypothetical protein
MSTPKPAHLWWSQVWKLATLLLLVSAYLVVPHYLPPRCQVESHWGQEEDVNWFGQRPGVAFIFAAAITVLLYSLRFLIFAKAHSSFDAFAWYLLLLASLLPAVWPLVVTEWDNEAGAPIGNWVGAPVALLFVPAAIALYDVATATRLTAWPFAARSLVEVVVLFPAWLYFWVMCMFLLLGWVGL